jgi:hypothetical protein
LAARIARLVAPLCLCALLSAGLAALGATGTDWRSVARAQDPDPEALIREGVEARRRRDDLAAVALFERSIAIRRTPRGVGQLALAEQALGRWLAADEHVREALAAETDAWVRERREILQRAASDVGGHIGQLEVLCSVEGARLSVDGRPVGALPLSAPVRVLSGEVVVEVTAAGYLPRTRTLNVAAGVLTRETIDLVPEPPVVVPVEPPVVTPPVVTPPVTPPTPPMVAPPVAVTPVPVAGPAPQPGALVAPDPQENLDASGFSFAVRFGYASFTNTSDGLFSPYGGGGSTVTSGGPSFEFAIGGRMLGGHLELGAHLQGTALLIDAPFDTGFDAVLSTMRAGAHAAGHLAGSTATGTFDAFFSVGFDPIAYATFGGPSGTSSRWIGVAVPLALGAGVHIGRGWMFELGLHWDVWLPREYKGTTLDGSTLESTEQLVNESMLSVTLGFVRAR